MFPGAVGALEMKAAVHLLPQGGGASPPPALAKGEVTLLLDFDEGVRHLGGFDVDAELFAQLRQRQQA
ncbi:MAG: hypothetical protein J0H75_13570, partial [Rhizobiales bacterium]|nr:hypothetical protein [Hyphomicrobiales bacterium]